MEFATSVANHRNRMCAMVRILARLIAGRNRSVKPAGPCGPKTRPSFEQIPTDENGCVCGEDVDPFEHQTTSLRSERHPDDSCWASAERPQVHSSRVQATRLVDTSDNGISTNAGSAMNSPTIRAIGASPSPPVARYARDNFTGGASHAH